MSKRTIAAAVCLLLLTGCHGKKTPPAYPDPQVGSTQKTPSATYDDPEAYAVYNALLGASDSTNASHRPIALLAETNRRETCSDLLSSINPKLREAAKDFTEQNSRERILTTEKRNLGRKVTSIKQTELDAIFSDGIFSGWDRFRETYPAQRSYIDLSAVGFSADRNFALVSSGIHCGPKCGAGGFSTFSKQHGVWKKNPDRLCSWIS